MNHQSWASLRMYLDPSSGTILSKSEKIMVQFYSKVENNCTGLKISVYQ